MSRGFVREGDQEEVPMVPQRAYLPKGVVNFVTPEGMEELLKEKTGLISERENLVSLNENENRIEQNYLNARLKLLEERISEARVITQKGKKPVEITFGSAVTLRTVTSGIIKTIKITGVDEADISEGKISFISPLARALLNRKRGDRVTMTMERNEIVYEIIEISYS